MLSCKGKDERTIDAVIGDIMSDTHERYTEAQRIIAMDNRTFRHERNLRTIAMEHTIKVSVRECDRLRTIITLMECTRLEYGSSVFVWDRAMRQLRHMKTVLRYCEETAEDRLLCLMREDARKEHDRRAPMGCTKAFQTFI